MLLEQEIQQYKKELCSLSREHLLIKKDRHERAYHSATSGQERRYHAAVFYACLLLTDGTKEKP